MVICEQLWPTLLGCVKLAAGQERTYSSTVATQTVSEYSHEHVVHTSSFSLHQGQWDIHMARSSHIQVFDKTV